MADGRGGTRRPRGPNRPKETGPNVAPDCMPLDYMLAVIRDPNACAYRRDKMAVAAAPYCHESVYKADPIGKKERKIRAAKTAEKGTEWAALVPGTPVAPTGVHAS